jgi:hypothetical protein
LVFQAKQCFHQNQLDFDFEEEFYSPHLQSQLNLFLVVVKDYGGPNKIPVVRRFYFPLLPLHDLFILYHDLSMLYPDFLMVEWLENL